MVSPFSNNWVSYGFGPDLIPFSANLPFIIDYSRGYASEKSSLDLAHEACEEISRLGNITLMLSGGVDSQAMAYAFRTAGIPTRNLMVRYNTGLNDHDIGTREFYDRENIDLDIVDLDLVSFHENELFEWAKTYRCHSPHILSHMRIAAMIDDGVAVGSGCLTSRKGLIGGMSYSVFGLERFACISRRKVIPFFFNYTEGLHYSFYRAADLLSKNHLDQYKWKCSVYRDQGYPVIPQRNKIHGFEKLKELYDGHPVSSKDRMRFKDKPSQRPYDLLFRYPLTNIVDYTDAYLTIFDPV